jgi:hypothetical protein
MSVLAYLVGGASIAVGTLVTSRSILSLTSRPAWHTQLRRWARIRPATKPYARRRAWNLIGIGLGLIVTATLLMLSEGHPALDRLTLVASLALLTWQLVFNFTLLRKRRSAS